MKYISLIILLTMFASCDNDDTSQPGTFISTVLEFTFEDIEGNDLLDPSFNNAYNHSDIEVFVLADGEKKILANLESPHFISNERGIYSMFIDLSNDTTYLKLSEAITDTFRCQKEIGGNYQYLSKVRYNNEMIWSKEDKTSYVKIVK
jgi:hypothetical protein